MGIVSSLLSQSNNNMKFLLVVAPVAYTHALPLTYATVPHYNPVVYTAPAAGCQNSVGAFVPCAQGSYFGYVPLAAAPAAPAAPAAEPQAVLSVEKREAEAEPNAEADASADPEADPWLYYSGTYGHGYGYSHYSPLTYSYAPYTYSNVYNHYGLGHYGLGGNYGLGYYGRKKREAEAEPEAVADPEADPWLVYGGYGGHGYRYNYAPYTYASYHHPLTYFYGGCRNNQGGLVPCAGR